MSAFCAGFILFVCLCSQIFKESIKAALLYKDNSVDFLDEVMRELEVRQQISELKFWTSGFCPLCGCTPILGG